MVPGAYGTDLEYMRGLIGYWKDSFDWRAQEAALNAYPQFKVKLHDIDVHYPHVPGQGPSPMPLLLMHGWPGSVFEFIDIIPRLTDPARFGGDPSEAFTVVAPSRPGFGLSFTPGQGRFNVAAIAACLSDLMTEVLGYQRYAAQGGDYGAVTSARLGHAHSQNLIGIHVNMLIVPPDRQPPPSPMEEERRYYEEQASWLREENRLSMDPRHQAAAAGLYPDRLARRPCGLDRRKVPHLVGLRRRHSFGHQPRPHARRHLPVLVTGAIGSSFWPYYARMHGPWHNAT